MDSVLGLGFVSNRSSAGLDAPLRSFGIVLPHRLIPITTLVVADREVAWQILALNTEKAHNLKERSLEDFAPRRRMASRRCRPLGVQKPPFGATKAITGSRKRPVLLMTVREPFVMGIGEIRLKGCWFHGVDRQDRKQQRVSAEWLFV
jgi:hypothetical protein